MTRTWTETEIAALVDGELEGEAEARARRAVSEDPEAAALAERIRATNALLRRAYPLAPAEVPDALRPGAAPSPARGRAPGGAPARGASRVARRAGAVRAPVPLHRLAAGVAFAALAAGAAAWMLSPGPRSVQGEALALVPGPAPADGPVHRALQTLASGEVAPEGVGVVATYLDRDARPCRELETPVAVALACRTPAGVWEVLTTASLSPSRRDEGSTPSGFSVASGDPASDPIAEALDALGAGAALSSDAEARLREAWR